MKQPIKITQGWRGDYSHSMNGRYQLRPVVRARMAEGEPMITVPLAGWLEYIRRGWMPITNDLRKWLDENGHKDVKRDDQPGS